MYFNKKPQFIAGANYKKNKWHKNTFNSLLILSVTLLVGYAAVFIYSIKAVSDPTISAQLFIEDVFTEKYQDGYYALTSEQQEIFTIEEFQDNYSVIKNSYKQGKTTYGKRNLSVIDRLNVANIELFVDQGEGKFVAFDFEMQKENGSWKVFDVTTQDAKIDN